MKRVIFALSAVLMISACTSNQEGIRFYSNYDNDLGWNESFSKLMEEIPDAPSGKMAGVLNAQSPYSTTFNLNAARISDKPLKSVTVTAQVKIEGATADPLVVIDIRGKDGNTLEWLSKGPDDIGGSVGKWVTISNQIDLTANNRNDPNNIFRIYATNNSPEKVLVDDIEIVFVD